MDSFEARLHFTQQLQHLNASVSNATKCAQFALRNGNDCEDLYSCIIEQLDEIQSLNTKVNILYFVEILCELSYKKPIKSYYEYINRDLEVIITKVVPKSKSGLANIQAARKVLGHLIQKGLISSQVYNRVQRQLQDTEAQVGVEDKSETSNSTIPQSKDEILRRMEQDRERHKRFKENIWVISHPPQILTSLDEEDGGGEFDSIYETCSDINQDDYNDMRNENNLLCLF